MREAIPNLLWIGNARDARDKATVLSHEIAAIIDLAIEETPVSYPHEIACCRFPLIDGEGNAAVLLKAAVNTATQFVSNEVRTLIACAGGMSRAVAVAAAVLARLQSLTSHDALAMVASTGPHDVAPALWADVMALCDAAKADTSAEFLAAIINAFEANKRLAECAIEQLPDPCLQIPLDDNTNSIAVIMKHIAGNLISRWTDFLTTDGEKPDRNRDQEFVDSFRNRAELQAYWERGWSCLLDALATLQPTDCGRTVFIRGEPHSVPLALERSLGHTCYHIGQIVQLARVHAGDNWNMLTIPRGRSEQFNRDHWGASGRSHS